MRGLLPIAGSALLALAACSGTGASNSQSPAKNTGPLLANPHVLGTIDLTRGPAQQQFTTYSFPSGAFNATSWFGHRDKIYYLNIRAFPHQNPSAVHGILSIVSVLPGAPQSGMVSNQTTVKIVDHGPVQDIQRWSSYGKPASLAITSLVPIVGSSPPAAKMTGILTATLCNLATPLDNQQCLELKGVVSTVTEYNFP